MDEVLPGLWVGGVRAAMDVDYLSRAGVTHIVTCMKQQIPVPALLADGRRITRADMKHVRIDDDEKAPILVHFAGCNELIHQQLMEEWIADDPGTRARTDNPNLTADDDDAAEAASAAEQPPTEAEKSAEDEGGEDELDQVELLVQGRQRRQGVWGTWQTTGPGTVLVHCQAGCSRSVAIVAAYLMRTRRVSARTAVAMIQKRRPDAGPNQGFMAQLELYEQVGFEIDMKWQAVRRFLMSKTDILNGDSMDDMLLSYYPSPYPSPALSNAGLKAFTSIISNDADDADAAERNTAAAEGKHEASTQISPASVDVNAGEGDFSNPSKNSSLLPHHHHPHHQHPPNPRSRSASSSSTASNSQRISHLSSLAPASSSFPLLSSRFSTMSTTSAAAEGEVKVTANSSGRLPGGVAQIRGHEGANNRGALPKPHFAGPKLRCKGCRRELAALDHVVIHEPGRGQMAFDHRKRDVGHAGMNVASNSQGSVGPDADAEAEASTAPATASATATDAAAGEGEGEGEAKHDGESKHHGATTDAAPATNPTATNSRRPIQSAASLASQLPPHLAALRGNRPRPALPTSAPATLPQSPSAAPASPGAVGGGMVSMLKSPLCSSYFVEPMAWMEALSTGEVTGRLNCPTPKCGHKLGSWDWAGMQCACGAWVTPAFSLHRSKVDEC